MAKKSHKKSKKKIVSKKNNRPARLTPPRDTPHIPSYDFLEDVKLDDPWDIREVTESLVRRIKSGDFLLWEAVMCDEQDLPLTDVQEDALEELFAFDDDPGDDILYINGLERPNALWYEIAREIIPCFVNDEPLETDNLYNEHMEAWPLLFDALKNHTEHLSLPEGAESALDIVEPGVIHQIKLRVCLENLAGLGLEEDLTLEDEYLHKQVEWLIDCLRQNEEIVRYFELTLESLLTKVVMPEREEGFVRQLMTEKLKLPSPQALLVDFLGKAES